MSQPLKLALSIGLGVAFLVYLIYSSLGLNPITCEICVEFRGRVQCRSASGETNDEAIQTGIQNACSLITNGRDESISCTSRPPQSATCTE